MLIQQNNPLHIKFKYYGNGRNSLILTHFLENAKFIINQLICIFAVFFILLQININSQYFETTPQIQMFIDVHSHLVMEGTRPIFDFTPD